MIPSLRNPVLEALYGPHRDLAEARGRARRYPVDVTPFFALPDGAGAEDWADAAALLGEEEAFVTSTDLVVPNDWRVVEALEAAVQAATDPIGRRDPRVRPLGVDHVPAMRELVARTRPGPFGLRTIELGGYVGIEEDGELLAMGGYRFRGADWVEISAVCTAPSARGRGLGSAIVRHLAAQIEEGGDVPVLHVIIGNPAQALYERLGFRTLHQSPGGLVAPPV